MAVSSPKREPDTQCNARLSRGRGYCKQAAGHGTEHAGVGRCSRHGGCSPKYDKKVAELEAQAEVANYGLPIDVDPFTALEQELCRTAGYVHFLDLRVQALPADEQYGLVGGGPQAIPGAEPHVYVRMLMEERKHLQSMAKTCIECGIATRRVELAEQQGQMLASAVRSILSRLGVLEHPDAPKVVREELTKLQAGVA
jgi:hypothetical protein